MSKYVNPHVFTLWWFSNPNTLNGVGIMSTIIQLEYFLSKRLNSDIKYKFKQFFIFLGIFPSTSRFE